MPRRSEEHLAMRREQVLEAALRCFADQGFHATTMADVIRASGLSAGSVYRYFPSKTALIQAGSEGIFSAARGALAELNERPDPTPPVDALHHLLDQVMRIAVRDDVDLTRVAVTAWAEALRDPALLAQVRSLYRALRGDFVTLLERWRDAGNLPADTDLELAGQVLFGAMPGFLVQRLLLGDVAVDGYVTGFASLMTATGRQGDATASPGPGHGAALRREHML
jgi:AcrR family transcriptional regulator